jgi:thioredoxin-related protein
MKKMLLVPCLFLFSALIIAQQKAITAKEILEAAYKKELLQKTKMCWLIFHASWCGWCHKMDSSINDPSCKKFFADNYIVTHLVVHESADKSSWRMQVLKNC